MLYTLVVLVVPYRCPFCGRVFERIFALKTHVLIVHVDMLYNTTCPCCGARVKSLVRHAAHKLDDCHRALHGLLCRISNGDDAIYRGRCREDYRIAGRLYAVSG